MKRICYLYKVKVDSQGYARKGTRYFGVGIPVYECRIPVPDGDFLNHGEPAYVEHVMAIRANSRDEAKSLVRETYSDAVFFDDCVRKGET